MLSLNKLSILFLLSLLISGTLYNVFLCFFMCFLTLRFVFLKNQSLVTVFTDQLHTKEEPQHSAQLQILGVSETFGGGYSFPVGNFSEACQFLFQELIISCSLWYLSVTLHILWSSHPILSSHQPSGIQNMPVSYQHPKSDETDTNPSDSSLKS